MSNRSRFRPNSEIVSAEFVARPAFVEGQRYRGVRRAGITFERKVGGVLEKLFGYMVIPGAWIAYRDLLNGDRTCSPDYLIVDVIRGVITIVECKLTHTHHAWLQLNDVYYPVIEHLFPGFDVRGVEVCKNFERSIDYPVTPNIVTDLRGKFVGGDNVCVMWSL